MLNRRFSIFLFSALLLSSHHRTTEPIPITQSRSHQPYNQPRRLRQRVEFYNHANPTITVTQGDGVSLQLSSGDAVLHRWFVDVDKNGPTPDCPRADICSDPFTTSSLLTFTVNFAPGTYTYYCSVHPTTMLGQFVVNPSSSVGGTALRTDRLALIAPYLGLASALVILVAVTAYITHARRKDQKN